MTLDRKQRLYSITGKGEIESFSMSFENADLVGNILVVEHRLDVWHPVVVVYNQFNVMVDPSVLTITCPDSNKVLVDFGGPIMAGSWHVRVIGG